MNLCKSPFLIMCLLESFMKNAAKVYSLTESGSEEGGGVSRAHLHLKQYAIKQLAVDRAVFDRVKTVLFYTTVEKLTKICYILFIKTLKNHISLWKMGIR